jgi:hypothetical protein
MFVTPTLLSKDVYFRSRISNEHKPKILTLRIKKNENKDPSTNIDGLYSKVKRSIFGEEIRKHLKVYSFHPYGSLKHGSLLFLL